MVQTNKILTVSYGAFSCTLEGFDDAFGTMKAIAEYFRDLAADDPLFGADPPKPDADLVARIARNGKSRKVTVRTDCAGIVLCASDHPGPELAQTHSTPDPAGAATRGTDRSEVAVTERSGLAEAPPTGPGPVADDLSAKLDRIRALVEQTEAVRKTDKQGETAPEPDTGIPDSAGDLAAMPAALSDVTDNQGDVPQGDADEDRNVFSGIDWNAPDGPSAAGDDETGDDIDAGAFKNILSDGTPWTLTPSEALAQARTSGSATRVIKVKRADLEPAITSGDLEDVTSFRHASSLSDADEADLQAELDAVAAELAETQAALNPPDNAPADPAKSSRDRASAKIGALDKGAPDVSRLMAEAATKMGEPVNSLRREAFSHLRAAVAAAEAEVAVSPDSASPVLPDTAYREDLASVMGPRRIEGSSPAPLARRRTDAQATPLKLVTEQRVSADTAQRQNAPVQAHGSTAEADNADNYETGPDKAGTNGTATKLGGFVRFAHQVGATELSELLEAGAAYMSFVEGWEQFSRPQLMTRVKQVNKSDFNREDGLRCFGQLLREGKIEKTSSGRFTASDQIGYRPTHNKAVG